MPFDPDEFLAGDFDPDSFLADSATAVAEPPSEGFPPDTFTQLKNAEKATDLLPSDARDSINQIADLQANPDSQDARTKASLYFAERLDIPLQDANQMMTSIAKQQWGTPGMSPEQIFSSIVKSEEGLLKNQVAGDFDLAPFSTFGNAFKQSLAGKPAEALKGAQVYTPGKAGDVVDVGLAKASDFFFSLQDAEKKTEVDIKAQGRIWPVNKGDRWYQISPQALPETINTWAANIGEQIPLFLLTMAGRAAGKLTGKAIGKAAGLTAAVATGGIEPTDMVTAPLAAKAVEDISKHIGGAAPMVAIEAAGFMDYAGEIGIDKDIAEGYARWYGGLSGAIEYSQHIFKLKAFQALTKKGQAVAIKKIFKVMGAAGLLEGLEEFSQNGLQNHLMNKAIADQRLRNPDFAAKDIKILEGGGRSFAIGAGVSLFTTGIGSASIRGGRAVSEQARKAMDAISERFANNPVEVVNAVDNALVNGKMEFDTPEDAQDFADRVATEAQEQSRDVQINVSAADSSVTVTELEGTEGVNVPPAGEPAPGQAVVTPEGEAAQIDADLAGGDVGVLPAEIKEKDFFHQTSKEAAAKIESEGFSLDFPRARLSDERIPDGIFLKSSDKDIGVGASESENISQIPVKVPDGKVLQVKDMNELQRILDESEEYSDAAFEAKQADREAAAEYDKVDKFFRAKPTLEEAKKKAEEYEIDVASIRIRRGGTLGPTDIELAIEDKILDAGDVKIKETATEARKIATKILSDKGYDYVSVAEDVGSFNRKTDTFIVLPHMVEKFNAAQTQEAQPTPAVEGGVVVPADDFSDFFEGFEADEVIERETPKAAEVQSTAKTRREISEAVKNDPVFQAEAEGIRTQTEELDIVSGKVFIPKKFKGEVKIFLEGFPALKKNITFERSEGVPFDQVVQESLGRNKTGVDETSGDLDVTAFLQRLADAKASRKTVGGVPQIILDKMMASGNPYSEIAAMRHDMFHKGFTVAEINEATESISTEYKLDIEPLLETKEDVESRERLSKRTPGEKGKLTRAETKAAKVKGETAAQLKARIKKLHKSTGVPVDVIREILRTNKKETDVIAELKEAQEEGKAVGFRAGEKESREKAKVAIEKIKQAQKLTDARRTSAVELVKAFVEKDKRGDFLKRVAEAKTPRDLEKINEAIEKGIVRAERKASVRRLRDIIKTIKPAKMLPEFKKLVEPVVNALKEGSLKKETKAKRSEMAQLAQQVVTDTDPDSIEHVQAAKIVADLAVKSSEEIIIDDLSVTEIDNLREFLVSMNFRNAFDTIQSQGDKATLAKERQKEVISGTTKPTAASKTTAGKATMAFKWLHDNLESMLDGVTGGRVGDYKLWAKGKSAFVKYVYDPINKGVDEQVRHTEQARDIARQVLADNGVTTKDILEWSARPSMKNSIGQKFGFSVTPVEHKITLEDHAGKAKEFTFTTNELMSIFMHTRNTHNLTSLRTQGINRHDGKDIQEMRGFTSEKIAEIIDKLTTQQKNVARQIGSKLMDGFNRAAINKTSVDLQGFELADIDNYWPAKRSITRTPKEAKKKLAVSLLENMGMLKERIGTGEALRMSGFFETVHDSNNNVAAYTGLAGPLREIKAVYNRDVILHLQRNGRTVEAGKISDFLQRLEEQAPQTNDLDRMFSHFLGNFAKSKLFFNLKIAPRQYLSLGLVKSYVDAKYFRAVRGKFDKALAAEMSDISPQLGRARSDGMQYDRDVGDEMSRNDLLFYLTGELSLVDKTAFGIGLFDSIALQDLFRITKAEVIDNNPDIDITSEEGQALLKDRFEWLARHTQPMWHVKDRSLIGSDKHWAWRSLTMFRSAREVITRMNTNAVTTYLNSEKTTADTIRLSKTMSAVAANMALFTLYNFAWATLIQKKDRDLEDLHKNFLKDILTLPFFGEYFEFFLNGIIQTATTGKLNFFERELDSGPIIGTIETAFDGMIALTLSARHFITGEKETRKGYPNKGEKKWKSELVVAADAILEAAASVGGLPYYGAKDVAKTAKAQVTPKKIKE